ncbi:MAG: tetratricopeptide repeat protein, partial [Candidatus Nitrotoga sp.]
AIKWYRLAAEQGLAAAQFSLGLMYHEGKGVPQNFEEAMKWARLAAEQGNASAQSILGGMYFLGQGVPQNFVHAYMWFNIAADNAESDEQKKIIEMRNFIAANMTASQIHKAQKLAEEFHRK